MLLRRLLSVLLLGIVVFTTSGGARAQDGGPGSPQVGEAVTALAGTGFTYQGDLRNGGGAVTDTCDFQFSLFDALAAGIQQGSTQTVSSVSVATGRFTVVLNSGAEFGARAFDGSARWLASAVRCPAGGGGYTSLTPRQPLTAAPLAFALPGLRTEPNATSPNVIGGHIDNTVTGGMTGATIAGGGNASSPNSVTSYGGTVGGGDGNTAGNYGVVAGGIRNTASGYLSTVGGGNDNTASGSGSFVGGGGYDGNPFGEGNTAAAAASTIGGGYGNVVTTTATYGTIGGGSYNTVSGQYATVPGGRQNTASGNYSFAAGYGSHANHAGTFVWTCGANCTDIYTSAGEQFLANAEGGFWFGGRGSGSTSGPLVAIAGTQFISTSTGAYLSTAGLWTDVSDRNAKMSFAPVSVLDALMTLPVESWQYKLDGANVRHIGPTAQDFYAAFGVGQDDTHLAALDTSGVALAAIQELNSVVQAKDSRIAALEASQAELAARVAALESGAAGPASSNNTLQLLAVLVVGLAVGAGLGLGAFALGRRQRA